MKDNGYGKFLAYLAIIIAVEEIARSLLTEWWHILLLCIGALVLLVVISIIWNKISDANNQLVDWMHYVVSKDASRDYAVLSRNITYQFLSYSEANYTDEVSLRIKRTDTHIKYRGRYGWSQEDEDKIKRSPVVSPTNANVTLGDPEFILHWTYLKIEKNATLRKGDIWDTGFHIENLDVTKYNRKSYLCIKTTTKTKKFDLKVIVPPAQQAEWNTDGQNHAARFKVLDSNEQEIAEFDLSYDRQIGGFVQEIKYPRLGRSYVIDWN